MSGTYAVELPLVIGGSGGPEVHVGTTDPSAGAGVPAPLGSAYLKTDTAEVWRKFGALDTDWSVVGGGGAGDYSPGWYGNGIDGDVTIPAGTTTLTKDMFYDNLVVENGGIIEADGFAIYAKTSITIEAGGTIRNNAPAATTNAGGAAASSAGPLGTGAPGGNGGGAGNGSAGTATSGTTPPGTATNAHRGGTGGAGTAGTGGAGGTTSATGENLGRMSIAPCFMLSRAMTAITQLRVGSGGGGGGGSGIALSGGGGGGGGGTVVLISPTITNDGAVEARGGNGAPGQLAGGGGGGGGAGGCIWVVTQTYTGNAPDVSGGIGGAGNGAANGNNGNDGITRTLLA